MKNLCTNPFILEDAQVDNLRTQLAYYRLELEKAKAENALLKRRLTYIEKPPNEEEKPCCKREKPTKEQIQSAKYSECITKNLKRKH